MFKIDNSCRILSINSEKYGFFHKEKAYSNKEYAVV